MNKHQPRAIIAAGGTGGHIYPGVALAQELKERGYECLWIGSGSKLEKAILDSEPIQYKKILAKPFRGSSLFSKFLLPFHLIVALSQALWLIGMYKPDYVITTGGYVSVTTAFAAKICQHKVFMCEQNSRAGLTNRLVSRIANGLFTAYPGVFKTNRKRKIWQVGNPLRKNIIQRIENAKINQQSSLNTINILVMGGSQGAQVFNEQLPRLLQNIENKHAINILHQAGDKANIDTIQEKYGTYGLKANVVKYIDDMALAYSNADFAIARSGALTLTELMSAGLPSILVPLPNSADNHQYYNALHHSRRGACWLLCQNDLVRDGYIENLVNTLTSCPDIRQKMRSSCEKLKTTDAAKSIITQCEVLSPRLKTSADITPS